MKSPYEISVSRLYTHKKELTTAEKVERVFLKAFGIGRGDAKKFSQTAVTACRAAGLVPSHLYSILEDEQAISRLTKLLIVHIRTAKFLQ